MLSLIRGLCPPARGDEAGQRSVVINAEKEPAAERVRKRSNPSDPGRRRLALALDEEVFAMRGEATEGSVIEVGERQTAYALDGSFHEASHTKRSCPVAFPPDRDNRATRRRRAHADTGRRRRQTG
jgi:hypothetical protein